jgi:hypothetical protein
MRIARKKVIATNNRAPEPLAVCAEQIGIALSLFRAAALDMTSQEAILPLSDRAIEMALLEPDALERGIGVIRIHFESSDSIHPVVQRVDCFLQLLREQNHNPHPLWSDIVRYHNQFLPVVTAIAWCPAHSCEAFDVVLFARIVSRLANGVNHTVDGCYSGSPGIV